MYEEADCVAVTATFSIWQPS